MGGAVVEDKDGELSFACGLQAVAAVQHAKPRGEVAAARGRRSVDQRRAGGRAQQPQRRTERFAGHNHLAPVPAPARAGQRLAFVAIRQGNVARLGLRAPELQPQATRSPCLVLPPGQAVARPASAEAPFSRSSTLRCDCDRRTPVHVSIPAKSPWRFARAYSLANFGSADPAPMRPQAHAYRPAPARLARQQDRAPASCATHPPRPGRTSAADGAPRRRRRRTPRRPAAAYSPQTSAALCPRPVRLRTADPATPLAAPRSPPTRTDPAAVAAQGATAPSATPGEDASGEGWLVPVTGVSNKGTVLGFGF